MKLLRQWPWGAMMSVGLFVGLVLGSFATTQPAGATEPQPDFYVALGGSGSVGVQPTEAHPSGQPTDNGYADDLATTERARWPDLRLVKFGCPGETTSTMLYGGDHCHYRTGSQLSDALDFIRRHASTVLVTLDVGFNNVRPCLVQHQVDATCTANALDLVHEQLTRILAMLRAAGDPDMYIVGVGHYDPFLGRYFDGSAGRTFALESSAAVSQLNEVLQTTYVAAGVPMANVAAVFDSSDTSATTQAGAGDVPVDVTRVCALTWLCDPAPLGPNQHPNDSGYQAISDAISALIPAH